MRGPPRPHGQGVVRTHDVVAGAEAQQRGGAVAEVGQHELAGGAVLHRHGLAGLGVDELGMDEAVGAQVHAVLLLALAPEADADVADPHRLGHARAPAGLELGAELRLSAAGLARDEDALDARAVEVALDEIGGVRRRRHHGLRPQQLDRLDQAVGVAGADRDVGEAEPVEGGERGAGHERAGVVGADDALAGLDAGGGVAARRAGHPVLEVLRGERDVARRAGGAAGGVDAHDLVRLGAQVRADRVLARDGRPDLALVGEREGGRCPRGRRDRGRPASRGRRASARAGRRSARGTRRRHS